MRSVNGTKVVSAVLGGAVLVGSVYQSFSEASASPAVASKSIPASANILKNSASDTRIVVNRDAALKAGLTSAQIAKIETQINLVQQFTVKRGDVFVFNRVAAIAHGLDVKFATAYEGMLNQQQTKGAARPGNMHSWWCLIDLAGLGASTVALFMTLVATWGVAAVAAGAYGAAAADFVHDCYY